MPVKTVVYLFAIKFQKSYIYIFFQGNKKSQRKKKRKERQKGEKKGEGQIDKERRG